MAIALNKLRISAAAFASEWADAEYEKAETQSFYNDFFAIFDVKRRSVARYEEHVKRLDNSNGYIDLFWPKVLLVEQKSAGRSLATARTQAFEYFDALSESERPRYLLLCDFQNWELVDLDLEEEVRFSLAQLPDYIDRFNFVQGVHSRPFRDQDPVNIEASELIGRVYDGLNASGYRGHDLERFLVRIVFCLFADNTGIFERDAFLQLLEERTSVDGADAGMWINRLFTVLDTPVADRSTLVDEDLAAFPHVNGDLFRERLDPPDFDSSLRTALIDAARFDWSRISPAIFGSLFQSVMKPDERRAMGAHYTTEQNILKVIEPLFLDDLRQEFERLRQHRGTRRRAELERFQQKLGKLRLLDPACGCGNFLIIAYRELRQLEIEVLKELYPSPETAALDVSQLSNINVHQFYGIEINEFPVRIAETALWMMDHIMNVRLSEQLGQYFARIPLGESPHIRCADALEIDWNELLPAEQCSYVFGNPPFGGFVFRDPEKQTQTKQVLQGLGASGSRLDYVAAWFLKAAMYLQGRTARIGFVATNSITQGEQVAQLWPALFDRYALEISFAHTTFSWGSDARGVAHVHVVIVGLSDRDSVPATRRLFAYDALSGDPNEQLVHAISPYLLDASGLADPHLVVQRRRQPHDQRMPLIRVGTKPVDDGHYLFDESERSAFLAVEPEAKPLIRPFPGAYELINNRKRWILHVSGISPGDLQTLPEVRNRIHAVAEYRAEGGQLAKSLADRPTEYHVTVVPAGDFMAIPEASSARRTYMPVGWLAAPTVPSNQLLVAERVELWHLGLISSAMHMAWLAHIGGRLKSDYRYSSGLVYNTFPLPDSDDEQLQALTPLAQAVLDARAEFPDSSLADLYGVAMPPPLRKAHQRLDRAVDRLYRRAAFESDRERVEHLLARYERMVAPLEATRPKRPRRRRRSS
ncbi:MAG: N-6 DNA methylase [Chloroflexota bacterium]|nr:N-6 DNA methylase [Chloroflexota bacterium]